MWNGEKNVGVMKIHDGIWADKSGWCATRFDRISISNASADFFFFCWLPSSTVAKDYINSYRSNVSAPGSLDIQCTARSPSCGRIHILIFEFGTQLVNCDAIFFRRSETIDIQRFSVSFVILSDLCDACRCFILTVLAEIWNRNIVAFFSLAHNFSVEVGWSSSSNPSRGFSSFFF